MGENNTHFLSHLSVLRYNKQEYTEDEILDGVRKNKNTMYQYIYKSYFSGIRTMVLSFHSMALDADDVFQDGLVIAALNIQEGRFRGESSFNTYLNSICRNVCRKQIERAGRYKPSEMHIDIAEKPEADNEELIYRMIQLKNRIDEKCCQIIDLRFGLSHQNYSIEPTASDITALKFEEIASILGIEPDNARQRFKRCLEKLKDSFFNHSDFN